MNTLNQGLLTIAVFSTLVVSLREEAPAQDLLNGRFVVVKHLGPGVNSASLDVPGSLSEDGRTLYFSSMRPWIGSIVEGLDRSDIYQATRTDATSPFGDVVPLPELNSPAADWMPFVTRDGSTYFMSNRDGDWDIFVADPAAGGGFGQPVRESALDLGGIECCVSVTCDEKTLFFTADQGQGSWDIWMTTRQGNGQFGPPVNLGPLQAVNTPNTEGHPSISCNGEALFFADISFVIGGNPNPQGIGNDDLWVSLRDADGSFGEPIHLDPPLSTEFFDLAPRITSDWPESGSALYFASNRPHPLAHGDFDMYRATWIASDAGIATEDEAPRTRGAINCGGMEVDVEAELGFLFEDDRFVGDETGYHGDAQAGFVVTRTVFGRVYDDRVYRGGNARPIDVSRLAGGGPEAAKLFAADTRSEVDIHYQALVVPGRYRVILYFAESSGDAVDGLGRGTRLITVSLGGEDVLCNWSAAAAAGSSTGAGDPRATCNAVLDRAVARSFSVDLSAGDPAAVAPTLEVVIHGRGGGAPNGDPALSALSFERTGDAVGAPIAGDIECLELPAANDLAAAEDEALDRARRLWKERGELFVNCGGPLLDCGARRNPVPDATLDSVGGGETVWVSDLAADVRQPAENEFFTVVPLFDFLDVTVTDMGFWDARGTAPGIDGSDRIFHTERREDVTYDIPVEKGTYEVSLYFANSMAATAGTAQRFFQVEVEEEPFEGFDHCPAVDANGQPLNLPDFFFDPVDHAQRLYSPEPDPCTFSMCEANGVEASDDPDRDGIPAARECGNAAATALRREVEVRDGLLTIALTGPDVQAGDPRSPGSPGISGLSVRRRLKFLRGDNDGDGAVNLADAVFVLNRLFQGGPAPGCGAAADANGDGGVNLTDAAYILQHLFGGGPPPVDPFPVCGIGALKTDDALGCATPCP